VIQLANAMKNNPINDIKYDRSETDDSAFENQLHGDFRLINPDGSFNIRRVGRSFDSVYEKVLSLTWEKIIVSFFLLYFLTNALFALVFMAIGPENINGIKGETWLEKYTELIYFSIQTFTTVGYGAMSPNGLAANMFAAFVAFIGLISFAILTGLSFAKFSKPRAKILFSKNMLIAPNPKKDNSRSLQFRVVNATKSQIIDLEARVSLAWIENVDGVMRRKFKLLDLELETIHLFPLNWTIVHSIDENSPLFGQNLDDLLKRKMEILILIKGFDDTYSKIIHSKKSYSCNELVDGAKFLTMYQNSETETILHLSKLDEYEKYDFS